MYIHTYRERERLGNLYMWVKQMGAIEMCVCISAAFCNAYLCQTVSLYCPICFTPQCGYP